MHPSPAPVVEVHVHPDDLVAALRAEAFEGLLATPKVLSPKWLYDDRGSALFEEITRLEEYEPFRRELAILRRRSAEIAGAVGADTLVELGSGTSEKTRLLLDALRAEGTLQRFVPFDVSEATLRQAAAGIAEDYPGLAVHAVVGDFSHHLDRIPAGGRRLVAFLGGTIGNFEPDERATFLAQIADGLGPEDALLLGTDLVKDERRLIRAYDDSQGVTAAFNLNVLAVMNRELGGHFDPADFEHVALYDSELDRIEMRLRATRALEVPIDDLGIVVAFSEGEEMRTEISAKFTRQHIELLLGDAGLRLEHWWTDPQADFALSLIRVRDDA